MITEIEPTAVDKDKVILLDTREESEYQTSHIPGGILLQPDRVSSEIEDLIPNKDSEIIIYCATGRRSLKAAKILRKKGYRNVQNLRGGIEAWQAAGLAVKSDLSLDQVQRYSRQMLLQEIGLRGQERLLQSRVLLVGAGGLGSPVALYLAAAGVGHIGIVDNDLVDISNLQRQILHSEADVREKKTASAKKTLKDLNSDIEISTFNLRLDRDNVLDVLQGYQVVVDGSDNFPTRYLLADATRRLRQTLVSAAILGFEGQLSTFSPDGACYRCLFPEPPPPNLAPSCSENGILGSVAGVLGTMQASEVLKTLLGIGNTLQGRLLLVDLFGMEFQEVPIYKNPDCPLCSGQDLHLPDYEEICRI